MVAERVDKRDNKRIFFTFKEDTHASLFVPGIQSGGIPVKILSLSRRGMSLSIPRVKAESLKVTDIIILRMVCLPSPLESIKQLTAVVKYLKEMDDFINIAMGCEFIDVSTDNEKLIEEFVEDRFKRL